MRRTGIILLAGCLWGSSLHAQEQSATVTKADSLTRTLLVTPPVQLPADWPRKSAAPISQERSALHKLMEQRAQQSVVQRPKTLQDPNKTTGLWRMTVGNTSAQNWSPFQDRALDARIIRFPQPRNMQPDKRPDHVKRLEKLNR